MINPETASEKLLFSTVRLETVDGSVGTGFFFKYIIDGQSIPVIITNRHVVQDDVKKEVSFCLHVKEDNKPNGEKIDVKYKPDRHFHPTKDLCFCFAGPLFQLIKNQKGKEIFYATLEENLIRDQNKLNELSAMEDVVMVGYPTGLWDRKNNFPLFRKGVTSTHPAMDFNEESVGAIDIACFPGSSGSPIVLLNENGYRDKKGNIHLGLQRIIFLGVLFAGPTWNSKGHIIIEDIPTQQKVSSLTPYMLNIGYYIRATEILFFREKIREVLP